MAIAVDIKNFRSIRTTTLELRPGLNILIGPNGSGKTNLLAGLKFLRDVFRQGVALAIAKGGGPVRNYYRGEDAIHFRLRQDYGTRVFRRRRVPFALQWTMSVAQTGSEQIATITREDLLISAHVDGVDVPVLRIFVDRKVPSRPRTGVMIAEADIIGRSFLSTWEMQPNSDSKAVLRDRLNIFVEELMDRARKDSDRTFFFDLAFLDSSMRDAVSTFTDMNEYNILPDLARQSTDQLPFAEISPSGAGLSEVLHALKNNNFHRLSSAQDYEYPNVAFGGRFYASFTTVPLYQGARNRSLRQRRYQAFSGALEKINEELSLAVRGVESVSTRIDPSNGRRFVVFQSGDHEFRPEEVSDGTIKWVSILTSIFVPLSTTYLLEEPENFLHPWMQQQLIRIMRKQAADVGTMFLITTHSATILNAAVPEEITVVGSEKSGTQTSRLEYRDDIQSVLDQSDFGLGDLWVSGAIGGIPGGGSE